MLVDVSHLPHLPYSQNSSTLHSIISIKLTKKKLLYYLCQNYNKFSVYNIMIDYVLYNINYNIICRNIMSEKSNILI